MHSDPIPSGLDPIAELATRSTPGAAANAHTGRYARRYPRARRNPRALPGGSSWSRQPGPRRTNEPAPTANTAKPLNQSAAIAFQRLGDYTLLPEPTGGMGIVYEAEHGSLKSRMALKSCTRSSRTDRASCNDSGRGSLGGEVAPH